MSDLIIENKNKKKALGRGLGSLFSTETTEVNVTGRSKSLGTEATREDQFEIRTTTQAGLQTTARESGPQESRVWQISVEKIRPGVYQPRTNFEKEHLEELAQSIKQNGILQPIIVRKTKDSAFEIVAGERRWRAAQAAGLHEVPAIIKNFNDKEALELAIVENIQREDLNPIEEAQAYARLANEFNLSQQQVAERVGKERATIANLLRILSLPFFVREQIEKENISLGHAKVLLSVPSSDLQVELAKKIINEKWSVRRLEKATIDANKEKQSAEPAGIAADLDVTRRLISGLSEELQKSLGTKVSIDYTNGKGKISISFYSDEELSNLVDRLKKNE